MCFSESGLQSKEHTQLIFLYRMILLCLRSLPSWMSLGTMKERERREKMTPYDKMQQPQSRAEYKKGQGRQRDRESNVSERNSDRQSHKKTRGFSFDEGKAKNGKKKTQRSTDFPPFSLLPSPPQTRTHLPPVSAPSRRGYGFVDVSTSLPQECSSSLGVFPLSSWSKPPPR